MNKLHKDYTGETEWNTKRQDGQNIINQSTIQNQQDIFRQMLTHHYMDNISPTTKKEIHQENLRSIIQRSVEVIIK